MLRKLNLDGDRQADLMVHGGWIKQCILIPQNIMITGVNNFLTLILTGIVWILPRTIVFLAGITLQLMKVRRLLLSTLKEWQRNNLTSIHFKL